MSTTAPVAGSSSSPSHGPTLSKAMIVVLNGTTGNLGTYMLSALAQSSQVSHIICLNRSTTASTRTAANLDACGLPPLPNSPCSPDSPSSSSKTITFHTVDFSDAKLGLDDHAYASVAMKAHIIVHMAWPVDWNRAFASFRPSVQGVRNVIDLALANTTAPARLLFVSSIAAAGNWSALPNALRSVPEAELDDWRLARGGYGQSKLVAERLLAAAANDSGLPAAVVRVGQVSGPVLQPEGHGEWPRQEWFPSLIDSSRYLECLPNTLGPLEDVNWVPVDKLAEVLSELVVEANLLPRGNIRYWHITNPRPVPWETLWPTVLEELEKDANKSKELDGNNKIRAVGLREWVDELEANDTSASIDQNPALKLLYFFSGLRDKCIRMPDARAATFELKNTMKVSQALAHMEPVSHKWIRQWMQQWRQGEGKNGVR